MPTFDISSKILPATPSSTWLDRGLILPLKSPLIPASSLPERQKGLDTKLGPTTSSSIDGAKQIHAKRRPFYSPTLAKRPNRVTKGPLTADERSSTYSARDASKNGVAHEAINNIRRPSKVLTEQEARQILGLTEQASWEEVLQKYDALFERNAKNGSFYIQSKVHRAKEALESVYRGDSTGTS
ncbi:uncharacterized protein A4U43_C01F28890 [Asparagus officinalis]|uniref:Uncharacterized protein n=1 Tax=Asparagus officinalis TaxID=4686 RepID=A0A5P1FW31_ASPOF|nr:uncharacterized protein A4U43_C01F28890 [Asparagus officinalis]